MSREGLLAGLVCACLFWVLLYATIGGTWVLVVALLCSIGAFALTVPEIAGSVKMWDDEAGDDWGHVERHP